MKTSEVCASDKQRREKLRQHLSKAGHRDLNGLDYLEVSDDQLTLSVFFMGKAPRHLTRANIRIDGGRRVQNIKVISVEVCRLQDQEFEDCMQVRLDRPGDFSTYSLRLVQTDEDEQPGQTAFPGLDPRYDSLDFSFKVNCPNDLDPEQPDTCPPPQFIEPELNYLAKDYASFKQLIYDRLALTVPDWQERHVPDIGVALVELLAYVGDYLSYYQDAVATEAYLDTARQRISVRRHARLVDYTMHEGCNARAWVHIRADNDIKLDPADFYFITGYNDALPEAKRMLKETELENIPSEAYEVFEPMTRQALTLQAAHNLISFYTWDNQDCCLPIGATTATLKDGWVTSPHPPALPSPSQPEQPNQQAVVKSEPAETNSPPKRKLNLKAGDFLLFEEVQGPKTGNPADANIAKRHVLRLTHVAETFDPLNEQPLLEITWAQADALPFGLCLSAFAPAPFCAWLEDVSVARGNLILVDHGQTVIQTFDPVQTAQTLIVCEQDACGGESTALAASFKPHLAHAGLTFSQPIKPKSPASLLTVQEDVRQAAPQIVLTSHQNQSNSNPKAIARTGDITPSERWTPRPDLLDSQALHNHFVVEIDNEGVAHLRFGDGELGRQPAAETVFQAAYRVGNGLAGNVGAAAISRLVFRNNFPSGVDLASRNPLSAQGGRPAETLQEVKLYAPGAFRTDIERAITTDDYATLAERNPAVQRAAATLRWTGSWYEVLVAIDPLGRDEAEPQLLHTIKHQLSRYKRIGHDLTVAPAQYVPLDVAFSVCVLPHYLRGHVKAALLDLFSNRVLAGGNKGFFHPDTLSFGEGVYLSRLVAVAQAIEGIESVRVTRLQRLYQEPNYELENGLLPLGALEIARLDNDPNNPEHGQLTFEMKGGR